MGRYLFVGACLYVGTMVCFLRSTVSNARDAASRRSARPLYCPAIIMGGGVVRVSVLSLARDANASCR